MSLGRKYVSCLVAELIIQSPNVKAFGGSTNWIDGVVLDIGRPPVTSTVWGTTLTTGGDVDVLYTELGASGCKHWLLDERRDAGN